jgi:hypothetical protein
MGSLFFAFFNLRFCVYACVCFEGVLFSLPFFGTKKRGPGLIPTPLKVYAQLRLIA